jgi:predicted double-glycine peptidase
MMQDVVTVITLLWYLTGRMMTQRGVVISQMEVREEMKMVTGVREVMTRKENRTRTSGEGMCW